MRPRGVHPPTSRPRRSQRTRSVLTSFAEDAATRTLLYANADLSTASQNREVIAFADHWHQAAARDPALLIFDSELTTQAVLAELDNREIKFITLRARHPGITAQLAALPDSAWTSLTLAGPAAGPAASRSTTTPPPRYRPTPRPLRQLAVSLDALAGAIPLNVDLDVTPSVLARTLCAALRRLPGYGSATTDTVQRRFLSTGGISTTQCDQITLRYAFA